MVGDHSQLVRFDPKHAAKAATTPKLQHQQVVKAVQRQQLRRKLPRTQMDFYKQQQAAGG